MIIWAGLLYIYIYIYKRNVNVRICLSAAVFQMVKIMEGPSATIASVNPPSPKVTLSLAPAAPTHRKARILTRDPLREAGDSMELQAEDDVRRWVCAQQTKGAKGILSGAVVTQPVALCPAAGSRVAPGRVQPGSVCRTQKDQLESPAELHL